MGASGKGGGDQARLQSGYNTGYAGYSRNPTAYGGDVNAIPWEQSDLGSAQRSGYMAAQQAANQPMFEMPMFEMPDFGSMSNNDQFMADYQLKLDQQAEENRRNQAMSQLNGLYSSRLDAANTSVDYINSAINQERSDAAMMGIDYAITDEDKTARINNYFASVWGEGDENTLSQLMNEWGAPKGHEGFTVVRGDASLAPGQTKGDVKSVGSTKGMKKKATALTGDEEGLGGGATILGGA